MLYVITDTHLGHKNMVKLCQRPTNFTELILKNCQKKLTRDDILIHLGDIMWDPLPYAKFMKLPCRKILIRGNHDKRSSEQYMRDGFSFVARTMTLELHGCTMLFSHAPQFGHTADINIHGHLHALYRDDVFRLYWPLSLEHMGYRPIALNDDTLHTLSHWVHQQHVPTLTELLTFRQNAPAALRTEDFIGIADAPPVFDHNVLFYTSKAESISLANTDFLACRWHGDVLFFAMKQNVYQTKLAGKTLVSLLLPWDGKETSLPFGIVQVKQDCVTKEQLPKFSDDVVRVWMQLEHY